MSKKCLFYTETKLVPVLVDQDNSICGYPWNNEPLVYNEQRFEDGKEIKNAVKIIARVDLEKEEILSPKRLDEDPLLMQKTREKLMNELRKELIQSLSEKVKKGV